MMTQVLFFDIFSEKDSHLNPAGFIVLFLSIYVDYKFHVDQFNKFSLEFFIKMLQKTV